MKRIRVPDEMLKAAIESVQDGGFDRYRRFLEAALLWLSEHPQVPTDEQAQDLWDLESPEMDDKDHAKAIAVEWQRRCFQEEEPEMKEVCGACVIHFIAGASFFPCALPKGHSGGHRAAGNCFKHGPYLGEVGAVPNCPEWPSCAEFPIEKEPEIPAEIKDLLVEPELSKWHGYEFNEAVQEAYRRGLRKGEQK